MNKTDHLARIRQQATLSRAQLRSRLRKKVDLRYELIMIDIKNYRITLEWSADDEAFIARVPALRGCITHGDTPEEAIHNIQDAFAGVVESLTQHGGQSVPTPDMTRQRLGSVERFLNLSALARESGLNKHTLRSKLRKGTRFTCKEAAAIEQVLP